MFKKRVAAAARAWALQGREEKKRAALASDFDATKKRRWCIVDTWGGDGWCFGGNGVVTGRMVTGNVAETRKKGTAKKCETGGGQAARTGGKDSRAGNAAWPPPHLVAGARGLLSMSCLAEEGCEGREKRTTAYWAAAGAAAAAAGAAAAAA